MKGSLLDRLVAKIDFTSSIVDCWLWTGAKSQGYGNIWRGPGAGTARAHRAFYELTIGPIPQGLDLDHLCRNPSCVNPTHLDPVTNTENRRRGIRPTNGNERKTHCLRGHPFDEANTSRDKYGRRQCRTCRRIDALERYYAQRKDHQ
jgi:hypothetical protein